VQDCPRWTLSGKINPRTLTTLIVSVDEFEASLSHAGPLIATLFPTLLAVLEFGSWQAVVFVFASLNVIQFVVGSYVEPRMSGTALAISPFLVLFSIFLWTFLWGLPGTFIGVPITVAALTFCAQHPGTRWLAMLLGPPDDGDDVMEPKIGRKSGLSG
jgi:predicted PurR-regulated permease PerM